MASIESMLSVPSMIPELLVEANKKHKDEQFLNEL